MSQKEFDEVKDANYIDECIDMLDSIGFFHMCPFPTERALFHKYSGALADMALSEYHKGHSPRMAALSIYGHTVGLMNAIGGMVKTMMDAKLADRLSKLDLTKN
jgi:hypothetical protein